MPKQSPFLFVKQKNKKDFLIDKIGFELIRSSGGFRVVVFMDKNEDALDDEGLSIYRDCENVAGVINSDDFIKMIFHGINVASEFNELFAALVSDDDEAETELSDRYSLDEIDEAES